FRRDRWVVTTAGTSQAHLLPSIERGHLTIRGHLIHYIEEKGYIRCPDCIRCLIFMGAREGMCRGPHRETASAGTCITLWQLSRRHSTIGRTWWPASNSPVVTNHRAYDVRQPPRSAHSLPRTFVFSDAAPLPTSPGAN